MMAAGLFLFLIGEYLALWRAFRAQGREWLVGAMAIAGIVSVGGSLEGLNLLTLVVVMFVVLVIEHRHIQRLGLHAERPEGLSASSENAQPILAKAPDASR
jgi:hypothetical protein